jgi:hypothetical protein
MGSGNLEIETSGHRRGKPTTEIRRHGDERRNRKIEFSPLINTDDADFKSVIGKGKSLNHKGHEGTQRGKPGSIERIAKTLRS